MEALAQSLIAWDVEIQPAPDDNPGATMPGSSVEGRLIAERYGALAVVWISESAEGFALWVYDARSERVLARGLPRGPPFDEPMAAQLALIVKTFLRSIPELAPVERPEEAVNSDAVPSESPEPDAPEPRDEVESFAYGWDLLLAGGVRGYATTPRSVEARFLFGATFWPERRRALGLTLLLESGPGFHVPRQNALGDTQVLDARWTASTLTFGVRGRLRIGRRMDMGGTLAVGANLTTLRGETRAGVDVAETHLSPHARVELELGVALASRLRIELRTGVAMDGFTRRYLVQEDVALAVRRVSVHALAGLEFRIQ